MDASKLTRKPELKTLTWVQHFRKRPGMYIGDPDERGLETCILELLSGPIAAYGQGRCDRIDIHLHRDGSITIQDDRRGPAPKPSGLSDLAFLERELTQLNRDWKPLTAVSQIEVGLTGVGPPCVAALSESFLTRRTHRGRANELRLARGIIQARRCYRLRPGEASAPGNLTRFKPDPQLFGHARLDFDRLAWRLRELAFLSPGLCLTLDTRRTTDGGSPRPVRFCYPRGIEDRVRELANPTALLHPDPLVVKGKSKGISIAVALAYQATDDYRLLSYVNYRPTKWGSTQLEGFLDGLAEAFNPLCEGEPRQYSGHFMRHGINCILDVRLLKPCYSSATKDRLCNTEAYEAVRSVCSAGFRKLFRANPESHLSIWRHLGDLEHADIDIQEDMRGGAGPAGAES